MVPREVTTHKLPNPLYNVNENIKLKQWFTTKEDNV